MRKCVVLGPMDPPIRLSGNDQLLDTYVTQMGSEYGRVLFAHGPMVEVDGDDSDPDRYVLISGCTFDGGSRCRGLTG